MAAANLAGHWYFVGEGDSAFEAAAAALRSAFLVLRNSHVDIRRAGLSE